jgi:hypothetical protein
MFERDEAMFERDEGLDLRTMPIIFLDFLLKILYFVWKYKEGFCIIEERNKG